VRQPEPRWLVVGAVAEGGPIDVGGLNPWDHYFEWTRVGRVTLQDPLYAWQQDTLDVWEVPTTAGARRFAAGEVSNGVWLFAVEAPDEDPAASSSQGD